MAKELVLKDYDIEKVSDLKAMADVLRAHIVKHKLYTEIQKRNYVHVDGWQFAGGMLGILPKVTAMTNLSKDGEEIKWMAEVDIVDKEGKIISTGFAICSNKEGRKKTFDEYAVMSMAQTRAIGKAYRNVLGWVMKLAGYETTPSEEVKVAGTAEKPDVVAFDKAMTKLRAAKTMTELQSAWKALTAKERADDEIEAIKNEVKRKLS